MWTTRPQEAQIEHTQVRMGEHVFCFIVSKFSIVFVRKKIFERTENGLKLIKVDDEIKQGLGPTAFQKIVRSPLFNMAMLLLVLSNAIITATIKFTHKEKEDKNMLEIYYKIEVNHISIFYRK